MPYKFEDIQDELELAALPTGVLLDERVKELKDKDWKHEEAVGDIPVNWQEKNIDELKRYSPRNQDGSLSCVANGGCIELEAAELIETSKRIVFSHKDLYIRRGNRPYGGMFMEDLFKLMRDGVAYESQVPSMDLGETPINQEYPVTNEIIQARATHAAMASFIFETRTMDKVAGMVQSGTPVILFWHFTGNEWWRQKPKILKDGLDLYGADTARHQAACVDFTLIGGKKYLVVQDSAGVGSGYGSNKDLRFVSEDFFDKRCYSAGYAIDKKNLDFSVPDKPKFNFTRELGFGMKGEDVKALQKILVYEKVLTLKEPTGNFLGMTKAGVKALQEKHSDVILKPLGLKVGTGYVGSGTLKYLKVEYGI